MTDRATQRKQEKIDNKKLKKTSEKINSRYKKTFKMLAKHKE